MAFAQSKVTPLSRVAEVTLDNPYTNSLGMKFVPVPITGGPTNGENLLFSIWDTRVEDYAVYVEANPGGDTTWKLIKPRQGNGHPVVYVSWNDARKFCVWLTHKEQKEGKIGKTDEYRLPTDHEWSCAVGIGAQEDANATPSSKNAKIEGVYPWGRQWPPLRGAGNYDPALNVDDSQYTAEVGRFAANGYGLYDMGGNVWQWCEDWYDAKQKYRVLRGGSWRVSAPDEMLSSVRNECDPTGLVDNFGFRCVLAPRLLAH